MSDRPVRREEWKQDSPRTQIQVLTVSIWGNAENFEYTRADSLGWRIPRVERISDACEQIQELLKFPDLDSWD